MGGNSKKKKTKTEAEDEDEDEDEVEQLLRVAEDDVLLKLAVNSHLKSDYAISPDLDHRFQALKSRTKKPNFDRKSVRPNSSSSSVVDLPNQPATTTGDPDDLFARFAALKGTLPCYSSSSSAAATTTTSSSNNRKSEEADDDEDEVAKVIRWAVDAARLDSSPCSDDDDDNEDNDTDSDDDHDDDGDDDSLDSENKRHRK